MWIGFTWLKYGGAAFCCEHENESLCSIKDRENVD